MNKDNWTNDDVIPQDSQQSTSIGLAYEIIVRANATDFEVAVNDAIAEGWRPQGGMSVTCRVYTDRKGYNEVEVLYYQAMVRCANPG